MDRDDQRLIDSVPVERRADEGIPGRDVIDARSRAAHLVEDILGDVLLPGGLRCSPLGPGWSSDLDVHCRTWPDDRRLADAGWLPLDPLLQTIGHRTHGRWAITEEGRVLAALDLHLGPAGDPARRVLDRCRRQRTVRLREVLELRELQRRGQLPEEPEPELVRAAAREAELGGELLADWRATPDDLDRSRIGMARLGAAPAALRRVVGAVRRRRRRRLVVALGGVDGSGKSTLAERLVDDLHRAGVPASRIWLRPGMGSIERIALAGRGVLADRSEAGVRQVARPGAVRPRSRRGLFGWSWALLVTLAYLWDVRRAHRRASGVIVYDRHLWDALVTMRFVYGREPRSLHHRLVRRTLPRADLAYHLDADAELATSRKRDPIFGRYAVEEQLRLYAEVLTDLPTVRRLDAHRSVDDLAAEVLHDLVRRGRPRS